MKASTLFKWGQTVAILQAPLSFGCGIASLIHGEFRTAFACACATGAGVILAIIAEDIIQQAEKFER